MIITVVVQKPDPNSASKMDRLGMTGHSGIAIADEFYDYGPQVGQGANLTGSPGRPWWDKMATADGDASLSEINDFIERDW